MLCSILGLLAGVVSAVRQFGWTDKIVTFFVLIGISTPSFFLGLILILLFAVDLRIFPASGMYAFYGGGDLPDLARHLFLPAVTLAAVATGVIARLTRTSMLEVLRQDYIRTARAKGLTERRVIYRHAFKAALVSVIPIIGIQGGFVIGNAVYIETVFQWPGIGSMLVNAISTRDFLLVQGGVLIVAAAYVLFNLAADVVQTAARSEAALMADIAATDTAAASGGRPSAVRLLLNNTLATGGLVILVAIVLIALAAPLLHAAQSGRHGAGRPAAPALYRRPPARHRRARPRHPFAPRLGQPRVACRRHLGDADRRLLRLADRARRRLCRRARGLDHDARRRHGDGLSLHPAGARHRRRPRPRPHQRALRHRHRQRALLRAQHHAASRWGFRIASSSMPPACRASRMPASCSAKSCPTSCRSSSSSCRRPSAG